MTIGLYLTRLVGLRIAAVLAGFVILGLTLDLLETSTKIVDAYGVAGLAEYALLRAPLILLTIMPVGVLAGAMLAFFTLAARSEMVVLRVTGLNTLRVVMLLVPLGLVCGILQSQLASRIGPAAEQTLIERFPDMFETPAIENEVWLRDWQAVVRIGRATPNARTLRDVSIFELSANGQLARVIKASTARYTGDGWRLEGATVRNRGQAPERRVAMIWHTRLTPAGVLGAARRPELVSAEDVQQVLSGDSPGARGTPYYLVQLWRSYAALGVPTVMLVFGALASFGLARSGGGARYVAYGLVAGATYMVVDGVLTSLGQVGAMRPSPAAFIAPIVFMVIGLWSIVVIEE